MVRCGLVVWCRFGPWFVEPIVAGLNADDTPFISGMDLIGAPVFAKDFVVAGTCASNLYGMCEALFRPDMVGWGAGKGGLGGARQRGDKPAGNRFRWERAGCVEGVQNIVCSRLEVPVLKVCDGGRSRMSCSRRCRRHSWRRWTGTR
jgi:hypothetical protein